jgi:hypothetical protein
VGEDVVFYLENYAINANASTDPAACVRFDVRVEAIVTEERTTDVTFKLPDDYFTGNDNNDLSKLNGTNVTVSGSGTLKLNAANTFNREHAVIRFADNGAINVPSGVTQVFAEGWDGENQMRGTYKSGSSSRVTGGGAIRVGDVGFRMLVR